MGMSNNFLSQEEINELLVCHESVDLLIPRGSNAFVHPSPVEQRNVALGIAWPPRALGHIVRVYLEAVHLRIV